MGFNNLELSFEIKLTKRIGEHKNTLLLLELKNQETNQIVQQIVGTEWICSCGLRSTNLNLHLGLINRFPLFIILKFQSVINFLFLTQVESNFQLHIIHASMSKIQISNLSQERSCLN